MGAAADRGNQPTVERGSWGVERPCEVGERGTGEAVDGGSVEGGCMVPYGRGKPDKGPFKTGDVSLRSGDASIER